MSTVVQTFLNEPLWRSKLFSDGWRASARTSGIHTVREPATGGVLSEVALASAEDVARATARASSVQAEWTAAAYEDRARVFRRAAQLVDEHNAELAGWIVRETGSIPAKAQVEIRMAVGILNQSAAMLTEPQGIVLPSNGGRLSLARRIPHGVVGVISPFNFPLILSIRRRRSPADF
jgi:benzaldehyde dehydrogenase (NAD)